MPLPSPLLLPPATMLLWWSFLLVLVKLLSLSFPLLLVVNVDVVVDDEVVLVVDVGWVDAVKEAVLLLLVVRVPPSLEYDWNMTTRLRGAGPLPFTSSNTGAPSPAMHTSIRVAGPI